MATTELVLEKSTVTQPDSNPTTPCCRFCSSLLQHTVVDLGTSPLCESYISQEQLTQMEPFYPLHVYVCEKCFLVQMPAYVSPETIFSEYAYFSSYAESWLHHASKYVNNIITRFGFDRSSCVIELGSNDGYLLQYFIEKGIPALGVDPAANVAKVAIEKGVPTIVKFFGEQTARELIADGKRADLLVVNNALAHVPNLNDFVRGMKLLLAPLGITTIEFPHLLQLIDQNEFDTIYQEHFSYFCLLTAERVLAAHGITVFDVEELSTHGGSLRIYARHDNDNSKPVTRRVEELRRQEVAAGLTRLEHYFAFTEGVKESKRKLLEFLISVKRDGKSIAGYGAPGKANTLLNYCGVRNDFIDYTVDRNPYKQGKFLPGTHIPIFAPEKISETKPDYVLILPWNLKREICEQLSYIREWGGRFVVHIPELQVF